MASKEAKENARKVVEAALRWQNQKPSVKQSKKSSTHQENQKQAFSNDESSSDKS